MASAAHNLSDYNPQGVPNAEFFRFGIVVSAYHEDITMPLYDGCKETLIKHGTPAAQIQTVFVPGAYELVGGAHQVLRTQQLDAVICLGCVIKGETDHDVYINHAVAEGLIQLNLQHHRPVIFGLLTPNNRQQALDRAGGQYGNKGIEAAITAIKMADLYRQLQSRR